jgi:hypothetical protein
MSRSHGICALVLIDDGAATTRDADVPEEIVLQRLRASSDADDARDDAVADADDGVPGILSPPSARETVVIGRQKGVVDHAMDCASIPLLLSRKHAALTCDGAAHYVRDLATTNGTFVNGTRIAAKMDVALKDGDVVAFGGPRYVARDSGRLANPFRYRYVRLERAGVDGTRKRPRASQESDGGREFEAWQGAQMSQVYQAVQASQTSDSNEELDDMLKARLRSMFDGEAEFAQACAKRYFGVVSPPTSPSKSVGKRTSVGQATRSALSSQNLELDDGLQDKLSELVVGRLRDRPSWVETELKCAICREWMTLPHALVTCGHLFCLECIDNSFCHAYTCPCCRSRPKAPRELLFTPSALADKLLEEYVIPTLTTKELLDRKAKEKNAVEARDKRVKRAAEVNVRVGALSTVSVQETQLATPRGDM